MTKRSRKGDMIILGDDEIRIEEGPVLKTAIATEELLKDEQTAPHYYVGVRPMTFYDAKGKPYEVPAIGRDALGKPIKLGEEMTYVDYVSGEREFKVYRKVAVDPTSPTLENGDENPFYVPEHVRDGATLNNDGTPPNRMAYEYIFVLVGSRKSEEAAIALGESKLGGSR
jgi:hypothetical protein